MDDDKHKLIDDIYDVIQRFAQFESQAADESVERAYWFQLIENLFEAIARISKL